MKIKEVLLYMKRRTFDIPVVLRREWFLIELAHLTKKYGIEIATCQTEATPFLRDQVTELKIGSGLQYDKYDDEYVIDL
ncbi:hypothetical protein COE58_02560 [Bacillus cereus]|nr:hypothetical protein bcere0009_19510 [Bacillus cereus R309803]PFW53644.1 hypothetical protein COL13_25355 [Bacillus cereus]PGZ64866.1 hypothetical protein COE58_02560 [Bacillus cereus]